MNESRLRDWLEIVGILAVVASLVFVGYEIRQSSQAAFEESIVSDFETMIAVEEIVVDNASVWLRGCKAEELSPDERMQFTHMYHLYESMNFMRWLRATQGVNAAAPEVAIDNMAWSVYRSPGFQHEWKAHGEWRSHVPDTVAMQEWRALVEQRVLEYPGFEPVPIDNVFRCGLN